MSRSLPLAVALLTALLLASAAPAADPPRYRPYYAIFDRGDTLIPGHDTRWVPQGLAYWPEKDALVISYYDGDHDKRSRLAVIARASGKRIKIVELPDKSHVGGLGMSGGSLWVAGGGAVKRYTKSNLEATADGGRLKAAGTFKLKASSFAFASPGQLWVGTFNETGAATTYHYRLAPKTESPIFDGQTIPTPSKVQGMAISGGNVIWSRSFGRDNDSLLDVRRLSAPRRSVRTITAPNMSEGLAIAGSELEVVYESGSAVYKDADYRVRTVHHGPLAKLVG